MSAKWPLVRLRDVLKPVSREESVDPIKQYRMLGIRLDGRGPFMREVVTGAQTAAAKLFRVAKDDFIYSRLFACRGAFGVVSAELDNSYVSGEFPTFLHVIDRLDTDFLRYWFRLPNTLARVVADCTGSTPLTRNRFKEHFFLALEIPLPPFAEQRRILARIEELAAQIRQAQTLRGQAAEEADTLVSSRRAQLMHQVRHFGQRVFDDTVKQLRGGSGLPLREYEAAGRFPVIDQGQKLIAAYCDDESRLLGIPEPVVVWGDHTTNVKLVDFNFIPGADGTKVFLPKCDISASFLYHFLKSVDFPDLGYSRHYRYLRHVMVPVPPPDDQRRIVAELDALQAEVDTLKRLQAETATELDALLPSVLDRAFKGEL